MQKGTNFYIVSEIQENEDVVSVLNTTFIGDENYAAAESKYFTVLAYAAVSAIEYHGATLMRQDGLELMSKVYDRRPVIEPEEEEEAGEE